jgi:hypothetical protein
MGKHIEEIIGLVNDDNQGVILPEFKTRPILEK